MKTLEQIKDEYAVIKGYDNWYDLYKKCAFKISEFEKHTDEVNILCQKQCLNNASENFKGASNFAKDTRESITNENNIIR